jgi:hypothetical protein
MKRAEKDILFIIISSFVLTVIWIGFNLYHKWVTTTIAPDVQVQIEPISSDFDLATLEKLKSRVKIAPFFEATTDVQKPDNLTVDEPKTTLVPQPTVRTEPTLEPEALPEQIAQPEPTL